MNVTPMPDLPARSPIGSAPISLALLGQGAVADIEEIVLAWKGHLETLEREFEILLILDGAPAADELAAQALQEKVSCLRSYAHADRRGLGPSLQFAVDQARFPLLLQVPCDKQYHPQDLARFLRTIDKVDLVVGYRVLPVPGRLRAADAVKRLLARILLGYLPDRRETYLSRATAGARRAARWIFGVRVQDPLCPYRLFRRDIFRRIPIQSRGDFTLVEVLAKANHLGCIMAEDPVSWIPPAQVADDPDFRADGWAVFRTPDFGPAFLPETVQV